MIFEGIITVFVSVVEWIIGLFPEGDPPGWFTSAGDQFSSLLGQFATLGAWVPINLAISVVGVVLACVGVGFIIRVVRIVASYLTLGGGSAG